MALYKYLCPTHGVIELDLKLGTAKEIEVCPDCDKEVKRIYSAVGSIWKTNGAFGKSST